MNSDLKKKWVVALRSKEYEQGRNDLCSISYDANGERLNISFCCLGVLADITDIPYRKDLERQGDTVRTYTDNTDILRDGEDIAITFPTQHFRLKYMGGIGEDVARKLATMNDDGVPFNDIADYIENNIRSGIID
jgi:hypothetical protein